MLFLLIQCLWETRTVPSDLKDALIVTVFKKGDPTKCRNCQGELAFEHRREDLHLNQRGGAPRITEQLQTILSIRFLWHISCRKRIENNENWGSSYFGPGEGLVPCCSMWAGLKRYGCLDHFMSLIQALRKGMTGNVRHPNAPMDSFLMTGGLKQGCVLAPTLFSIYPYAMLREV